MSFKLLQSITMETIDLNTVRTSPDARIFSGRDSGRSARHKLHVERLERSGEHIVVRIPDDTIAVNLSFFLGLFGSSIQKMGETAFRKRYEFVSKPVHERSINEGIRKALLEGSVFDEGE